MTADTHAALVAYLREEQRLLEEINEFWTGKRGDHAEDAQRFARRHLRAVDAALRRLDQTA
jgi:hypothetical protein